MHTLNESSLDKNVDAARPSEISGFIRWVRMLLQPGIGIKRWILLGASGVVLVAVGIAFALAIPFGPFLVDVGRTVTFGTVVGGVLRGVALGVLGFGLIGASAFMLYRRVAFGARYQQNGKVIEGLTLHRFRSTGPKVVAIGGGTGLSSLLRGLKHYTHEITAIVTVADDGGSSGRLREELGISPPGDARQCLIALSESEPMMEEALSYRFESGAGLEGHNLGNLLLAALVHTRGSFHDAVQAAGALLAVRGKVVPSSIASDLRLMARTVGNRVLTGESAIGHAGERIGEVWLEPADALVNQAALDAIASADIIVIGPGSLYTSILPNLLVRGISDAINRSVAPKVLVCNIATQHGETDGLSAEDHLRILEHTGDVAVTHFLVNEHHIRVDPKYHQDPVVIEDGIEGFGGAVLREDLVDVSFPTRHDPMKLADSIYAIVRSTSRR
ncbi:MAG: gluconeogenesis factor YvcK family protein [Dehalococcoidia bacterium]